jgi:hypothetical protein
MALGISAIIAAPCYAQRPRANGPQNHPAAKPPKQQQRPAQRQGQNTSPNRPPNANANRAAGPTNNNPNRPPSAYTPPPKKNFNDLSPQDRQKVLQNYKNFQKLSPAQRQQQKEAADNWSKLTPQQKNHIQNDVIPKWKQLPPDRQRAISQRLGVLKNMPESARNQHLNDPNFTRGMSEEDKATLKDLSHMHVGGAPEPPSE